MAAPPDWVSYPEQNDRARTEAPPPNWVSDPQQNGRLNIHALPADHPFNNYGREPTMASPPNWVSAPDHSFNNYRREDTMAPPPDWVPSSMPFGAPTAENFQNVQNLIRSTDHPRQSVEGRVPIFPYLGGGSNDDRTRTEAAPPEYSDRLAQEQDQSWPEHQLNDEDYMA